MQRAGIDQREVKQRNFSDTGAEGDKVIIPSCTITTGRCHFYGHLGDETWRKEVVNSDVRLGSKIIHPT